MQPPIVPERTSSKRSFSELQAQQPMLRQKRSDLSGVIQASRKKLRPSMSFDSDYWARALTVAERELERLDTVESIEEYEFLNMGGSPDDWLQESTREELELQRKLMEDKIHLYGNQIEHLGTGTGTVMEQAAQRSYVSCFLSSKLGASADVSAGSRDTTLQSRFRNTVFEAYHAVPGPANTATAWDIASGTVIPKSYLTASHLFAYRHGEDALIAIFGEEAQGDIWSAGNGLCLPAWLEEHFESGIYTIYPDFADNATYEERATWHHSEPKEYRIRFLDKPAPPTNPNAKHIPLYHRFYEAGHRWCDLDGQRLKFQGTARPKARYIYFHFLLNMLRFAWRRKETAAAIIEPELGMPFWGTPGAYTRKGQLECFDKQLGHHLPKSQVEPTTPTRSSDQDVLVEAIKSQMLNSSQKKSLNSEEYEDSDDEESEEEEESED